MRIDGLTDRVRLPSESRIEVIFHQLYVAGVEFPPGGRLVKWDFSGHEGSQEGDRMQEGRWYWSLFDTRFPRQMS